MVNFIILAIFILTLAVLAGGILIASHLRTTYKADFLSTLLFYQVFLFTFGFYVFWGQVLIVLVLKTLVTNDLLTKVINITAYLGSPFLIFAGLMFLKFTREISGRKTTGRFIALFLSANTLIILVAAYMLNKLNIIDAVDLVKYVFMIINILYTILGLIYLLKGKKKQNKLKKDDIKNITFWLIFIMLVQNSAILFYDKNIYFTLLFIVIFYLLGVFIPVYLRYFADLSMLLLPADIPLTFNIFCQKYDISKREKEVIYEVCNGLSNQQIADKLFISLQTVKDHTHRIYFKTNCSSRTQLIKMVNVSL